MADSREIILSQLSPTKVWSVEVCAHTEIAQAYYAKFRNLIKKDYLAFPIGYAAPPTEFMVRWDLPDNVCGFYLHNKCFALFRLGAKRRRRRKEARLGKDNYFDQNEIDWFCSKPDVQNVRPN